MLGLDYVLLYYNIVIWYSAYHGYLINPAQDLHEYVVIVLIVKHYLGFIDLT